MKGCIFGSGATGGYMGVELARAGAEVSLVARGAHLQAIRENGLKLLDDGLILQSQANLIASKVAAWSECARAAQQAILARLSAPGEPQ